MEHRAEFPKREVLANQQIALAGFAVRERGDMRIRDIANASQGFVYYIARTGVTGARRELRTELAHEVAAVRAVSPLPVAVGFGVSTPGHARAVGAAADAAVVGSALVDALDSGGVSGALDLARALRAALDEVGAATVKDLSTGDTGARMTEHGGEVVIPIADRPYGKREGRIRDPFGHLWIVSTHLFDLPEKFGTLS